VFLKALVLPNSTLIAVVKIVSVSIIACVAIPHRPKSTRWCLRSTIICNVRKKQRNYWQPSQELNVKIISFRADRDYTTHAKIAKDCSIICTAKNSIRPTL